MSTVDYYDVQAMIRDAVAELRGTIRMSTVDYYDVQAMIRDAVAELRGTIRDLERELREEIGNERVDRQNADESLERVLASRTEHLV